MHRLAFAVCIAVRSLWAASAKLHDQKHPVSFIVASLAVGIGLLLTWGRRDRPFESSTGVAWWDCMRPLHASLWIGYGLAKLDSPKSPAWILLASDVAIGVAARLILAPL